MKPFRFSSSPLTMDCKHLWSTLSPREKQIAILAAQGKRTREIASMLAVSPQTIDSHFKHIFGKLQIHSRVELANVVRECID